MRYLLVVGFFSKKYKVKPSVRISLNNILLDEFYLDDSKKKDSFFIPQKRIMPVEQEILKKNKIDALPNLRIYEIELDCTLKNPELKIIIKNQDNNYTNGFMTKSTLINLWRLFLIPYNKKLLKLLDRRQRSIQYHRYYAWQYCSKNVLFNLRYHCTWYGDNKQIFDDKKQFYDIGGNGFFLCNLRKKYNLLIPHIPKPYRVIIDYNEINHIIAKYEYHANQRNTI